VVSYEAHEADKERVDYLRVPLQILYPPGQNSSVFVSPGVVAVTKGVYQSFDMP